MNTTLKALLIGLTLAAGSFARADEGAAPAQPPEPPKFAWPAPATITSDHPQVRAALTMLCGTFAAPGEGERPALRLGSAPISVAGLDNAVYFEITREDSPREPFRAGIWHVYARDGKARLRVYDLGRLPATFSAMAAGLYNAPETLPALKLEQLSVNFDAALSGQGEVFEASVERYPSNAAGAFDAGTRIRIAKDGLSFTDQGYSASGSRVWGSESPVRFAPVPSTAKVDRRDNGLVLIDLVEGTGDKAENGYELAMAYTGWTGADGTQFDTSRQAGREPIRFNLPAQLIPGWNLGIPGISKGTLRKLVIPPVLGYGERGNPRARIPANSVLVFESECVYLKKLETPTQPDPAAPGAGK